MDPRIETIVQHTYVVGIVQALFTALVLLSRKRRNRSGLILSLFLLSIAADLIAGFRFTHDVVPLIRTSYTHLVYGPFFLLYLQSLLNTNFRFHWRQFLHLIPLVIMIFVMQQFEEIQSIAALHQSNSITAKQVFTWPFLPVSMLMFSSIVIYSVLILKQLLRFNKNEENYFSTYRETHRLQWIRSVAVFYLLFMGGNILFHTINMVVTGELINARIYMDFVLVGLVFIINCYGLQQPQLFHEEIRITKEKDREASGEIEPFLRKLHLFMESKRPYLNPDLTVQILADYLQVERTFLTRALNDHLEKNFFAFINEYRVEEAKRRLGDPSNDHLTLLAVALDSGFSSKSSFNALFKKYTEMTPSQFREKRA